jgi:predicted permease
MEKTLLVLKMILPVFIILFLGYFCRRKKIIDQPGLIGIKTLISRILIPVVLFNAFYKAEYNWNGFLIFVIICCCNGLGLVFGNLTKKLVGNNSKLMPFLLSGYEVGMLGYALFTLLVGADNIHYLATVDFGQTLFVYTIYIMLLTSATGGKPTAKGLVMGMVKNPAFIGAVAGMFVGATGLGTLILNSAIGGIFRETLAFITAPTSALILIIVGYEISFRKELMKPVFKTIGLRLLMVIVLFLVSSQIIFHIIPFNKMLFTALLLFFSLPATFIIPLYANIEGENEYVSTTLSMNTLVTIVIFFGLAFYVIA